MSIFSFLYNGCMKKILLINTALIASITPVISLVSCNKNRKSSYEEQYLTFEALNDGELSCDVDNTNAGATPININLYYSLNGGKWTKLEANVGGDDKLREHYLPYKKGDVVCLKNDTEYWSYYDGGSIYWDTSLHFTGLVNVFGNVMSLLYGDNFVGKKSFKYQMPFYDLFEAFDYFDSKYVTFPQIHIAENLILPATSLNYSCYSEMFDYCDNLQIAPKELPALDLARSSYDQMFRSCEQLQTAPKIRAQTASDYCCSNMFSGCKALSITTEPSVTNHKFFTCPDGEAFTAPFENMFAETIGDILTPTPGQTYYWVESN